jgi:hypothetical protein
MLGKKGAPRFFKVVPREEAATRASSITACAARGCGLLEFGLAALLRQPMLEGACIRACAARGCGLLELELRPLGSTVQEGGRLVVMAMSDGDE